jgi:hypothetical protein
VLSRTRCGPVSADDGVVRFGAAAAAAELPGVGQQGGDGGDDVTATAPRSASAGGDNGVRPATDPLLLDALSVEGEGVVHGLPPRYLDVEILYHRYLDVKRL